MKTSVQTASKSKKRPPTTSSPADDARRWREGATTPRCPQNAATHHQRSPPRPQSRSPAAAPGTRPSPSRTGPRDNLSYLREIDSSNEDVVDECSRTPRRALRQLLPRDVAGGRRIMFSQTYATSSNEDGDEWSRTPRRALRQLLPRVERLAAPANHARPVWKSNVGAPRHRRDVVP